MKSLIRYSNFILFTLILLLLIGLKSHTHISTSLLSILDEGESKELITSFETTQNAKILLLSTKGFDEVSLSKIKTYEKKILEVENIEKKEVKKSQYLYKHLENYKLFSNELNNSKLKELNVKKTLEELHHKMTSSFFPAPIDKIDPFHLFPKTSTKNIKLKNGYLTLGDYGYLSIFVLKSKTLEEHKELYNSIHSIVEEENTKVFSPLFYFVENSNAIRSDVDKIILIATIVLFLLYFILLKEISLLLNTMTTLATSAMVSTIILAELYNEISIFVFVFGISVSTIAIDYMFHHYLHGYYAKERGYNKEVLFGFLTTISAFFILSFTSFLLIKQIALFALFSLTISYVQFAFLYPHIKFKPLHIPLKLPSLNFNFLKPLSLFFFSLIVIILSSTWLKFDTNIRNLDYDNKKLKKDEAFFSQKLTNQKEQAFVIKASSIKGLIEHAHTLNKAFPTINLPLAKLISVKQFRQNNATLKSLAQLRITLKNEAETLKFRKDYFIDAYRTKNSLSYTQKQIQAFGIDIIKINDSYINYGRVNQTLYKELLKYSFVESISLKERFENSVEASMEQLIKLGILSLLIIVLLLYVITKKAFFYALLFLIFPMTLVAFYAYFVALNILHIFMLIIIIAIGIDYAIYLSKESTLLTKQAITYSLVSTFAGFGVLVFSNINALFSLGVIASIGIVGIFILLIFMKGENDES